MTPATRPATANITAPIGLADSTKLRTVCTPTHIRTAATIPRIAPARPATIGVSFFINAWCLSSQLKMGCKMSRSFCNTGSNASPIFSFVWSSDS